MNRKLSIAILAALVLLMLLLASSLLIRGCPRSRHGYQASMPQRNRLPVSNNAMAGMEPVSLKIGAVTHRSIDMDNAIDSTIDSTTPRSLGS